MKKLLFGIIGVTVMVVLLVVPVSATTVTDPSGETHLATYITVATATLNAFIDDDGGDVCQVRFEYYTGSGTWTDNITPWVTGYHTGDTVTADISGLTSGDLYMCRAEIENSTMVVYDGDSVAFSAYAAPSMPSTWFATPDYTKFKHAFFYGLYNLAADGLKVPRNTFYMLSTIFWCIGLAIGTLVISKRLMAAVIVLCGFMAMGALIRLLPMFFVAFSVIAILGIIQMGHPVQGQE
jgi:hypothetical protein